jgi:hypothetical protein
MFPVSATTSVLDCMRPCPGDSARVCIARAALCGRLARLVRGRLRRKLRRYKDLNIKAALSARPTEVHIGCDRTRHFGLLSISHRQVGRIRVHTHENWLRDAG